MISEKFKIAFFVIGNIIGSGFFLMPSILAPIGMNMIFSWIIAVSIAITFAMIFGRLYVLFPNLNVLSDYFNDIQMKKTIALLYWISVIIANTGILIITVASLNVKSYFFWGFLIIFLLTLLNHFLNYDMIAKIEILFSFTKFALLILLPLFIFIMKFSNFHLPAFSGSIQEVSQLGIAAFWCFIGIETASVFGNGKDAKNGLLIGVIASSILYIFTSLLVISFVPTQELKNSSAPFVLLMKYAGFEFLANYIGFLTAFTALGALYGWIAATSKMALFYSKSGVFPKFFGQTTNSQTSKYGLWISSIITYFLYCEIFLMKMGAQFDFVATLSVYLTLLIYGLCANELFFIEKNKYDQYLAILGIILVVFSLSLDLYYSFYAICLFCLSYMVIKISSKIKN